MRTLLFALTLLTSTASFACPGGNLKSLSANGRELAQINMTDSSIHITDGTSKITGISTIRSRSYQSREQCGQVMNCENSELLAIDVLEDPQAVVVVAIREAHSGRSRYFKVTDFNQTRAINGCAEVVEPLE